ncbi:MAG: hypothetical protein HWD58_22230 [Bacteroidota bacterium]|nr:MAG: hypothetical protein HWD58_22230 [Bacteroidota bacterium]
MLQGDNSLCEGESLSFEAYGMPALHQWITPTGNYTAGSTLQKIATLADYGSWIHVQSVAGCTSQWDTFQVEVLAQPNLQVSAQVLLNFVQAR